MVVIIDFLLRCLKNLARLKIGKIYKKYPLSALIDPNTGQAYAWYLSNQYQFVSARPKFTATHISNEITVALLAQTIACLPRFACHTYLSSGELVELFSRTSPQAVDVYVYRPQRNITHPRVNLVFD